MTQTAPAARRLSSLRGGKGCHAKARAMEKIFVENKKRNDIYILEVVEVVEVLEKGRFSRSSRLSSKSSE